LEKKRRKTAGRAPRGATEKSLTAEAIEKRAHPIGSRAKRFGGEEKQIHRGGGGVTRVHQREIYREKNNKERRDRKGDRDERVKSKA